MMSCDTENSWSVMFLLDQKNEWMMMKGVWVIEPDTV